MKVCPSEQRGINPEKSYLTKKFVKEYLKRFNYTSDVEVRIQNDTVRIKKICEKYLGCVNPWLPLNQELQIKKWTYYHDKSRKLGWCFNPKVSKHNL